METKILEMAKLVSPTKVPDLKDAPSECKPS